MVAVSTGCSKMWEEIEKELCNRQVELISELEIADALGRLHLGGGHVIYASSPVFSFLIKAGIECASFKREENGND